MIIEIFDGGMSGNVFWVLESSFWVIFLVEVFIDSCFFLFFYWCCVWLIVIFDVI